MDINDGEWPLPPAGPQDEAMSERLMATGGRFSAGGQWNIDCMVRVIAPVLDEHGLLDGPAPWLEIRRSRSEMAGGVTVEFDPHPDETHPKFRRMRHFRFRQQRLTKSEEALADLRLAAERRALLMRRREGLDSGTLTLGQATTCVAVVPPMLRALGLDPLEVAALASDGAHVARDRTGKTGDDIMSMHLVPDGENLEVNRIELPGIVYRSAHGEPSLVLRNATFSDDEMATMIGRPLKETVPRPEFDVDDLTVTAAVRRGDSTILTLSRPRTTLVPLPR